MADRRAVGVLRQVGDAARAAAPDAALLAWFAADRDEAAFAELVRRHGPLVLGVCRRVARHRQDAEDAFQAAFLVLARKAGRLDRPELLANWLYGVAYRVASRARRSAARRRAREGQVATMPEPTFLPPEPADDLAAVLDDALNELPERFRSAVLLCDLSGVPRAEAAARLGIPEGTLSSRLAAGRKKLAGRLARRGVAAPAAGLAAAVGGSAAGVPPELAARAVAAAVAGVSGRAVPAAVRILASEGGATMGRILGAVAAAAAAVGLTVGAVAAWPGQPPADPPKPPAAKPETAEAKKPAPAADKPAGRGKPRMMKTTGLDNATGIPVWSPDGSMIAVSYKNGNISVLDGWTLDSRMLVSTGRTGTRIVGFTRKRKPSLVTYVNSGQRINEVTQLQFQDVLENGGSPDKPDRVVDLDPADGIPFAIMPDDKAVLAVATDQKFEAGLGSFVTLATHFRLIDATTGEVGREVARVDNGTSGYALSPDGRRLVVGSFSDRTKGDGLLVQSFQVADGKRLWSRKLEDVNQGHSPGHRGVAVSPDGKLVAVTVVVHGPESNFGRTVLLDGVSGEPGTRLDQQANESWAGLGFSNDGRLFVGRGNMPGSAALRVWDTRTGKTVKTWEGRAVATFAPDRPVLAVLETYYEPDPQKPNAQSIQRNSLGLWDLSALAK